MQSYSLVQWTYHAYGRQYPINIRWKGETEEFSSLRTHRLQELSRSKAMSDYR
jgi:hypothetical protein